ncbi:hypothetical protein HIM_03424 [Hirsutella minnesotensis 3608]|uniref:Uncharacterized protein n=1 Tax=Hirsutella minnesotensis 3608 TaxID=1043627 RepID=A0A0F7ZVS1_9HYPO|nr:hypothetical protein HIM_03424 [Hirsutella minnesotensis 3608]
MASPCPGLNAPPGPGRWRTLRPPNLRCQSTPAVARTRPRVRPHRYQPSRFYRNSRADMTARPATDFTTLQRVRHRLTAPSKMSNPTSKVPTSEAGSGSTSVPSSAVQQPSSAGSVPAASSVATPSAAQPSNSTPQQQQHSSVPTPQPPASSVPPAAASSATPSQQQPPAHVTPTQPQNATPTTTPTTATTPSVAVPPVVVTPSSDSPRQQPPNSLSTVVTVRPSRTATSIEVVTATTVQTPGVSAPSVAPSSTSTPTPIDPSAGGSSGLSQPSKVAIGVVVPIAAIALLAVMGLFWWRKRRARQEAEEERRKEVEDYSYNPNADPTMPSVGHSASNSYEMKEDGAAGYRGWGSTTAAGSTGRKTSTTLSGGGMGAYSDLASPTRGTNPSEARSVEPLLDASSSPDGEILGAMGPSAAYNRGADVRRGPSNASSSYSVAARSENSDGGLYGNGSNYYEQYGQNPYGEQRPHDLPTQAVIRDNPARRNTRIENSAHYPQQSAGIAQNF